MSDKFRRRRKQTYQHKPNAVCVTVYHPMGESLSESVQKEIEESVWQVAQNNKLLISIATT